MKNLCLALTAILVMGCEFGTVPIEENLIVVESYLVAGRPLQGLRISKTVSPSEASASANNTFMPASGAVVLFSRGPTVFNMIEDTSRIDDGFPPRTFHGTYRPAAGDTIIASPGDQVALSVSWQGRIVHASTTVPPQVAITQAPTALPATITSFILAVAPDSLFSGFLVVAKIDHSQPLNPQYNGYNFMVTAQTTMTVPMSMLHNVGVCRIYVYALDRSSFEYLKTRKTGNPTQSLIQPTDFVSGGLGLFSAATVDSVDITVQ